MFFKKKYIWILIHLKLVLKSGFKNWRPLAELLIKKTLRIILKRSSTIYNPFLYAWLNDNFHKEFRIILPCIFKAIDWCRACRNGGPVNGSVITSGTEGCEVGDEDDPRFETSRPMRMHHVANTETVNASLLNKTNVQFNKEKIASAKETHGKTTNTVRILDEKADNTLIAEDKVRREELEWLWFNCWCCCFSCYCCL